MTKSKHVRPVLGTHQTDSEFGVLCSRGVTWRESNQSIVHLSMASICGVSPSTSGPHVQELAYLVGASASVEKKTDIGLGHFRQSGTPNCSSLAHFLDLVKLKTSWQNQ